MMLLNWHVEMELNLFEIDLNHNPIYLPNENCLSFQKSLVKLNDWCDNKSYQYFDVYESKNKYYNKFHYHK